MPDQHVALILVEGETEEVFYKQLIAEKLVGVPKRVKNLRGNFSINKKILDKSQQFSNNNPGCTFDVYVCVDQERVNTPVYNAAVVHKEISNIKGYSGIYDVIANLMLESLFFIDINNIYKFLRTPKNKRNGKKFSQFRTLTHRDMTRLFKANKKLYTKGHKCEYLVDNLDLELIVSKAPELKILLDNAVINHNMKN